MEDIGFDNENKNKDNVTIKFVIEITGKFKSNSTIEYTDYQEALAMFNQYAKEGKNLVLYEVQKSAVDGSLVKKLPVLNTSKHAERMKILEEEAKINALHNQDNKDINNVKKPDSGLNNKPSLSNMKFKIIILASVVGGFIITLFLLNVLSPSGENLAGHLIIYDFFQKYVQFSSTNLNWYHQQLISIYFMF